MKQNLTLTVLVGAPISLAAIYLSGIAVAIAYHERPRQWDANYAGLLWLVPGILGSWATFTGLRNLLRFDRAHLCLRWHDWVGGSFGFLINSAVFVLILLQIVKEFEQVWEISESWIYFLIIAVTLAPNICFGIVAIRFFKHRKSKT